MRLRLLEQLLTLRIVEGSFTLGDAQLAFHHRHPFTLLGVVELLESYVPRAGRGLLWYFRELTQRFRVSLLPDLLDSLELFDY